MSTASSAPNWRPTVPEVTEPTRAEILLLANDALAIGGAVACLLAIVLGIAFVRAVW